MGCGHGKLNIIEFGTVATFHNREIDGTWSHCTEIENYTGELRVSCNLCGLDRTYSAKAKRPKWLQYAISKALE